MALSDIRDRVQALVSGIADIGRVHDYIRHTILPGDFQTFFKPIGENTIRAWQHSRTRTIETSVAHGEQYNRVHIFTLRGYNSLSDKAVLPSEKSFQDLSEQVCAIFRTDPTLNSNAFSVNSASVSSFSHDFLGNILCHLVEIEIEIEERVLLNNSAQVLDPADIPAASSSIHDKIMDEIDTILVAAPIQIAAINVTRGRNFPLISASKAALLVSMPEDDELRANNQVLENYPVLVRLRLDAKDDPGVDGAAVGDNAKRLVGSWLDAIRDSFHIKTANDYPNIGNLLTTEVETDSRDNLFVREVSPYQVRVESDITVSARVWRQIP